MSRFNTPATGTKTTNLAGGIAYSQTPEMELISILLTSFVNDQFYRSSNDTMNKVVDLIGLCDPLFVAKAAIYARTKFGMRSISHVVASELAPYASGREWATRFYNDVVHRPDDMMEIIAYHKSKNGKLTNAIKRGFASAFDKFDAYQLGKYKGAGKSIKLIDVVNLVHPIPNEKNAEALKQLVAGDLKSTGTWEAELTNAGQIAETEEEKIDLKKDAWVKLIRENKIGYFALLQNLRNIILQAPEIIPEACNMLINDGLIKKSLVLPFRFITAFDEVQKMPANADVRTVMVALNQAVDKSLSNIPTFDGSTLVVLDVSGSMQGKPSQIGSLFAAVLAKANNADLMVFAFNAEYRNVNMLDSITTIASSIRFSGGGTNFSSIFAKANKKYDRIVILSDMQGWMQDRMLKIAFNDYKKSYQANPFLYSFDLTGYGSLQFPERNVFCLAGFNEKIFDVMKLVEQNPQALINQIKSIEL